MVKENDILGTKDRTSQVQKKMCPTVTTLCLHMSWSCLSIGYVQSDSSLFFLCRAGDDEHGGSQQASTPLLSHPTPLYHCIAPTFQRSSSVIPDRAMQTQSKSLIERPSLMLLICDLGCKQLHCNCLWSLSPLMNSGPGHSDLLLCIVCLPWHGPALISSWTPQFKSLYTVILCYHGTTGHTDSSS